MNELVRNPQAPNTAAYERAMRICLSKSAGFIGIDDATELASVMQGNAELFRDSLASEHFTETMDMLEGFMRIRRTAGNRDFVDAIPSFAQTVVQDSGRLIERDSAKYTIRIFHLINLFTVARDSRLKQLATDIFVDNLNNFLQAEELTNDDARALTQYVVETATPQQIKVLVRAALTPNSGLVRRFPNQVDSVLYLSILGKHGLERDARMQSILEEIIDGDANQLMAAWEDAGGEYVDNFGTVCQLERRRPGITSSLMKEFGIMNFARYPIDLMLEQYDTRGERTADYGVIVAARHDSNGIMVKDKKQVEALYHQAKQLGCRLQIYEAESVDDIVKAFDYSGQNHGPISFGILMAHGYSDHMRFGSQEDEHVLETWDLQKLSSIRQDLIPGASLYLISCSAGIKDGLAQKMSEELPDIEIHAADFEAFLAEKGIEIERVNGIIKLKILFARYEGNYSTTEDILERDVFKGIAPGLYLKAHWEKLYPVVTRVYKNGKLIRDYTN